MHEDHDEEEQKECDCECHQMHGPMKAEFKLAMLEKKEKILHAKLEFIGKIKEIIKNMPTDKK
jgi:hypothetical protein